MTRNLPAALVGLTVLVTSVLVHAGFAVWWMVEAYGKANPPPFNWVGSLTTSGILTAVVLAAGLVVQRIAGGNVDGITEDEVEVQPQPAARPVRPASEATVVVPRRQRVTSA